MKKLFLILTLLTITAFSFGQARLVLNNNGFININNSAFLVIDNSAANAITTLGTGGKIISEGEMNRIKWNIGASAAGSYVIPWATSVATSSVKIPLTMAINTAGVGAGNVIFSTYETTTDANTPTPLGVTNMCAGFPNADGSLKTVDRFWQIDANTYTTKPAVTMTMAYNPAANELAGTNTLVEANLQAQRFNPGAAATTTCYTGAGSWQSLLFGTVNTVAKNVSGIVVTPTDFYKDWTLTDRLSPLPVKLTDFDVACSGTATVISWSTASEINNDYFVVQKSYDAVTFVDIATVQGAGNSNTSNFYSIKDAQSSNGAVYYRLKQVDFDGTIAYNELVSSNCNNANFDVTNYVFYDNQLSFNVTTTTNENVTVYLYDYRGRIIIDKQMLLQKGLNPVKLSHFNLSTGIYMLSIIGEQHTFATKLFKRK